MKKFIVSIDAGTTSIRSILFDIKGKPIFSSQKEFTRHYARKKCPMLLVPNKKKPNLKKATKSGKSSLLQVLFDRRKNKGNANQGDRPPTTACPRFLAF